MYFFSKLCQNDAIYRSFKALIRQKVSFYCILVNFYPSWVVLAPFEPLFAESWVSRKEFNAFKLLVIDTKFNPVGRLFVYLTGDFHGFLWQLSTVWNEDHVEGEEYIIGRTDLHDPVSFICSINFIDIEAPLEAFGPIICTKRTKRQ